MKQQETQTISDINCFDEKSSIYKVLFQDRTTSLLKYIIEKLSIDRYENVKFRLPSILISGKEGKHLLARAFGNSLCFNFEEIQGVHIGMGGYCGSLYQNIDNETVYYVSSADELASSTITVFHKFLNQGFFKFHNNIGEDRIISANNKLFIFSVDDHKKLCPDLYKTIDYYCFLQNYSIEQMELIVEQRLKWCRVDYVKEIPAVIVRNGEGSISNCIRLLSVCYLIMRGDCRTNMIMEDVEKGIVLNQSPEVVTPPPISENIPF